MRANVAVALVEGKTVPAGAAVNAGDKVGSDGSGDLSCAEEAEEEEFAPGYRDEDKK